MLFQIYVTLQELAQSRYRNTPDISRPYSESIFSASHWDIQKRPRRMISPRYENRSHRMSPDGSGGSTWTIYSTSPVIHLDIKKRHVILIKISTSIKTRACYASESLVILVIEVAPTEREKNGAPKACTSRFSRFQSATTSSSSSVKSISQCRAQRSFDPDAKNGRMNLSAKKLALLTMM